MQPEVQSTTVLLSLMNKTSAGTRVLRSNAARGGSSVSKMKIKTNLVGHSKMIRGLKTRKLASAGHLAGRKHNTLSADLCNENKISTYYKMRACGIRIENRLGRPGQGK